METQRFPAFRWFRESSETVRPWPVGTVGIIGAAIPVVVPGSMFSAASVLAIVAFNLSVGWRTLTSAGASKTDVWGPRYVRTRTMTAMIDRVPGSST